MTLQALLPSLPLRTRALAALHLALALPPAALVTLCLRDVTLASRGLIVHLPTGDREIVGPAISEARAYRKQRGKETRDDHGAPLFGGCRDRPLSASYARKLLHRVAVAVGSTVPLIGAVRQQGGGLSGW